MSHSQPPPDVCHHCGSYNVGQEPGRGPHFAKLTCHDCGGYRWLPKPAPVPAPPKGGRVYFIFDTLDREYGIDLLTTYDPAFVAALKAEIPTTAREWDHEARAWYVSKAYQGVALAICQRFYAEVVFAVSPPPPAPLPPPPPAPVHTIADCLGVVATTYPHHRAIGAWPGASPDIVQATYRACARKFHPDTYQGRDPAAAATRMVEVNAAYEALVPR